MSRARRTANGNPLHVGVTGHRPNRLPERVWGRIKADLAEVMAGIEGDNPGRRPVLLSGLAEGADRLAAFVALGRGWALHAILAFHRTRFEQDFAEPAAVGEFRALLAAASELTEPGRTAHIGRPPEDGYGAVGRKLIARSDVLIAVWDGEGSRGRGGTTEVIEQVRLKGTPAIWIHALKPYPPRRMPPVDGPPGSHRRPAPKARRR
jgi:hypothetical protein